MNFCSCKNITDEAIKELSQNTAKMTQLAHFDLNLTEYELKIMIFTVVILINFCSCWKITDEAIKELSQNIGKMTQLTHFNLYLQEFELKIVIF